MVSSRVSTVPPLFHGLKPHWKRGDPRDPCCAFLTGEKIKNVPPVLDFIFNHSCGPRACLAPVVDGKGNLILYYKMGQRLPENFLEAAKP